MYTKDKKEIRKEYEIQLKKLKKICSKLIQAPHHRSLSQEYGLRDHRWFMIHCENNKVKDYNTFMEYEVGIKPNYLISEKGVSDLIFSFISKNNRSPMRKDFDEGRISISTGTIQRVFGSIRKMQKKLGIIPNKSVGGIERKKTIKQIKFYINEFFKSKKESIFSIGEMNKFFKSKNFEVTYATIKNRLLESEGLSLREYVKELGFEVVKPGRGLTYTYEDGERSYSYNEKIFSKILRENNFVFNSSYFRDLKYSKLFPNVEKNFTLDYLIIHKGRKFYIEVAGILRDHENFYHKNIVINSNSKEKYRMGLREKEKILKKNKVKYFLIFSNKYKNIEDIIYEKIYFLKKGDLK